MHTSKAFRCTLPGVRDDQVTTLRRWADLHCAQSIAFRDDRGGVVLVGLKDEFRTCASFSRTVRTALRRLCIRATEGALVFTHNCARGSEHLHDGKWSTRCCTRYASSIPHRRSD